MYVHKMNTKEIIIRAAMATKRQINQSAIKTELPYP